RAADKVSVDLGLQLQTAAESDDQVLPAMYETKDDLRTRREKLQKLLDDYEASLRVGIYNRTMYAVQSTIAVFINRTTIEPLKLGRNQEWFGIGVAGVMSSKY